MKKNIKTKKRIKIKYKNILLLFLILICIVGLSFSVINIVKWKIEGNKTNKTIDNFKDVKEIKDDDSTVLVEQENIDQNNPYWDYIKMNLIDVDFEELKKTNDQTQGWIQINGTNINYPFVQTDNNKFYLTHSFDKTYNSAGWVFMDYRNSASTFDKNTIIYAHGRLDKIMFGSLKNILTSGWLKNTENYVVKLSTETQNTLWQVFSVYRIPTTNDYIQVDFNDEEFLNLSNTLIQRSAYDFNTAVNQNDKILTLSTCYNKSEKVVLHAKLIKYQDKAI